MTRAERAKMTRKNRAYYMQQKKTTWKHLNEYITGKVQNGEGSLSALIKKLPYEVVRRLHAEGYIMYPNPNAKGQIIIEWEF